MNNKPKITLVVAIALSLMGGGAAQAEVLETRIGKLEFTHDFANGYPTDKTVEKLYNEIDFQRACQAYLWALPLVSMVQWQHSHNAQIGAKNGQLVLEESYDDKLGGLTYNLTTPYVLAFIDLSPEGPFVIERPEGEVRGATHDMWQIAITPMAEPGKYLFVGSGQSIPEEARTEGYSALQSPMMNFFLGVRLMATERNERMRLLDQIKI